MDSTASDMAALLGFFSHCASSTMTMTSFFTSARILSSDWVNEDLAYEAVREEGVWDGRPGLKGGRLRLGQPACEGGDVVTLHPRVDHDCLESELRCGAPGEGRLPHPPRSQDHHPLVVLHVGRKVIKLPFTPEEILRVALGMRIEEGSRWCHLSLSDT